MDDPSPALPELPVNPEPAKPPDSPGRARAVRFAKCSLWFPFVGFPMGGLATTIFQEPPSGEMISIRSFLSLGVVSAVWMTGLLLGIFALWKMKKYGRAGIFARALTGTILNSVLLIPLLAFFVFSVNTLKRIQRSNETGAQFEYDKVKARVGDGPALAAALLSNASRSFIWEQRELAKEKSNAWTRIAEPFVLDMAGVSNRQEILSRMEDVQDFIDVSKRAQYRMEHFAEFFRRELDKHLISPQAKESNFIQFTASHEPQHQQLVQLTKAGVRQGETIQTTLIFLSDNWGKWKYQKAEDKIVFDDNKLLARYDALVSLYGQNTNEMLTLAKELSRQLKK